MIWIPSIRVSPNPWEAEVRKALGRLEQALSRSREKVGPGHPQLIKLRSHSLSRERDFSGFKLLRV